MRHDKHRKLYNGGHSVFTACQGYFLYRLIRRFYIFWHIHVSWSMILRVVQKVRHTMNTSVGTKARKKQPSLSAQAPVSADDHQLEIALLSLENACVRVLEG